MFGPKGKREGDVQKEGPGNTTKTKFTWKKKRKGKKGEGGKKTLLDFQKGCSALWPLNRGGKDNCSWCSPGVWIYPVLNLCPFREGYLSFLLAQTRSQLVHLGASETFPAVVWIFTCQMDQNANWYLATEFSMKTVYNIKMYLRPRENKTFLSFLRGACCWVSVTLLCARNYKAGRPAPF